MSGSLCERCHERPWVELWSPDGLGGHEILVCLKCYAELSGVSTEPIPQADLDRAKQFVRDQGWVR